MRIILTISALIAFIIISFSAAYYFIFFLPNHEKLRQDFEIKRSEIENKTDFDSCYEKCASLGYPPENNACNPETHLGTRKTDVAGTKYKAGDPWCYVNEGLCIRACKIEK